MSDDAVPAYSIEPIWVVEATYAPDAAETRPAVRPEHLARVAQAQGRGHDPRGRRVPGPVDRSPPRARAERGRGDRASSATTSTCARASGWSCGRSPTGGSRWRGSPGPADAPPAPQRAARVTRAASTARGSVNRTIACHPSAASRPPSTDRRRSSSWRRTASSGTTPGDAQPVPAEHQLRRQVEHDRDGGHALAGREPQERAARRREDARGVDDGQLAPVAASRRARGGAPRTRPGSRPGPSGRRRRSPGTHPRTAPRPVRSGARRTSTCPIPPRPRARPGTGRAAGCPSRWASTGRR